MSHVFENQIKKKAADLTGEEPSVMMHEASSSSIVDEKPIRQTGIGACLRSAGSLFARSSQHPRTAPHAVQCRKEHAGEKLFL